MTSSQSLLDRASRRFEIDHKLARAMEENAIENQLKAPIIAISREFGSGGTAIGQIVANQLGFAYYDRELIEEIAAQTDTDVEHLEHHEAGGRSALSSILLSFMDRRNVQDTVYLRSLLRVLRQIAGQGRAVVIGRGAGYVLPNVLRIRFVAPFDIRLERVAKLRDLGEEGARQEVLTADHAQARFVRDFFGRDVNDSLLYDLVINTGALTLEQGAELVIMRLRQTGAGAPGKEEV